MWKGSTHAGERRFAKALLDDRNELLVVAVAIARPQQIEHVVFHDVRIDNPCNYPVTRACGRIFRNGARALPKRLKFVDGIRWRRRDEAKIDTCIRHGEVKLGISPANSIESMRHAQRGDQGRSPVYFLCWPSRYGHAATLR